MKRQYKILLLVFLAALFFMVAMPKVEDLYRREVAKKVVERWKAIAEKYAAAWKVDPKITLAIICQESGGNPDSVNPADPSRGLMQITPGALADFNAAAGRSYTFEQMFDPYLNIEVGTWYFATRVAKTRNTNLALAAYNAGLGNLSAGASYADKVERYLIHVSERYLI